jgi:hypothetical protein
MNPDIRKYSIKEKALIINLDPRIYGSFAEIGAGQEVAANFFKAGGSSGTIAQTMSAYDMTFSDARYGKAERYVSEHRLTKMMEKEYSLLLKRLGNKSNRKLFFSFANTIETISYGKNNQGHGWIGLRFQLEHDSEPNECVIHIFLHDRDNNMQQQAAGAIGTNLIFACFFLHRNPDGFIKSLTDEILPGRVEIDLFRLTGPDFDHIDNRLMALKLVKNDLSKAAMFGPDGTVMQPADALYNKNVLMLSGRFRPVTHVSIDMLKTGLEHFLKEPDVTENDVLVLADLTLNALSISGDIDEEDFLDRVDILCSLGETVLISSCYEYFDLIAYLSNFTKKKKIGIILGIYNLHGVFNNKYYTQLKGGLLESFGMLFGRNVKMFVYPALKENSNQVYSLKDFELPKEQIKLFEYLLENGKISPIEGANENVLNILSDEVLEKIRNNEEGWEKFVPGIVADMIKLKNLFGYIG